MFCLWELRVHAETRNISELHKIYFNAKSISPRVMQRDLCDQCIFLGIIPAGETRRKCKSKLLPTRFFQHLPRPISLPLPRNQSQPGHSDRWQSTGITERGILTGRRWAIKLSSLRFTQENLETSNQYCLQILGLTDKERGKAREDSPRPRLPQGGEQRLSHTSVIGVREGRGRPGIQAACRQHMVAVSRLGGWPVWHPHAQWQELGSLNNPPRVPTTSSCYLWEGSTLPLEGSISLHWPPVMPLVPNQNNLVRSLKSHEYFLLLLQKTM